MKTPTIVYGKTYRSEYPSVREITRYGKYRYYLIDCRNKDWKGKPYEQKKTKEEALTRAREIAGMIEKHGISGVVHDLEIQAFRNLKNRLAPFSVMIEDVVEDWISFRSNGALNAMSKRMNEVVDEWVQFKVGNVLVPLSNATQDQVRLTQRQLHKAFNDLPIKSITKENVQDALAAFDASISKRSINIYRKMWRAVFRWAISEKKYIKVNPCDDIKIKVPQTEIKILSVDEVETVCKRLLTVEKLKAATPYVVLGMFCGLRPNEATQVTWDNVNFETKEITIKGGTSKVRRTRHVKMSDNLIAWLKPFKGQPIKVKNLRGKMDKVSDDLTWCADILRHTAISFTMAKVQDIEKTAYQMGNSGTVIKQHYMQGVPEAWVEKFWNLTPTSVQKTIDEKK